MQRLATRLIQVASRCIYKCPNARRIQLANAIEF